MINNTPKKQYKPNSTHNHVLCKLNAIYLRLNTLSYRMINTFPSLPLTTYIRMTIFQHTIYQILILNPYITNLKNNSTPNLTYNFTTT